MNDPIMEATTPAFEGEIWLSTDGKHTIHVKASTREGRAEAAKWAKSMFEAIQERYGTKQAQAVREYTGNGKGEEVPVCPYHEKPMQKRQGKFGEFWSCGTKLGNGQWCGYKPDKAR